MSEEGMYGSRARLYDRIYHFKDYASEAGRLRSLLAAEGVASGSRVVEAACGTGNYLRELQHTYRMQGFDLSASVISIAREKAPEATAFVADMIDVTLNEQVDALFCLFSSIGYVFPEENLRKASQCFARAVRPGGALVIEPWIAPDVFKPGRPVMQTYDSDDLKLCRASLGRREGELAVLDFHWLVVARDAPAIEHFVETHRLWLCPTATMLRVFEDAGFSMRVVPEGLMRDRALLVGKRRA